MGQESVPLLDIYLVIHKGRDLKVWRAALSGTRLGITDGYSMGCPVGT